MSGRSVRRQVLGGTVALALLGACSDTPTPVSPEAAALEHASHAVAFSQGSPAYHQQLASLRRATAPYHNFDRAQDAGWDWQFTPCISNPTQTAAMGYHYVNRNLMDAVQDVTQPEALIYAPDANGRLRLVAVEYIVPFSIHGPDEPPPTLYGLPYSRSPAFQVWGLHAWVWKNNPDGMHAPFNPEVSCTGA